MDMTNQEKEMPMEESPPIWVWAILGIVMATGIFSVLLALSDVFHFRMTTIIILFLPTYILFWLVLFWRPS